MSLYSRVFVGTLAEERDPVSDAAETILIRKPDGEFNALANLPDEVRGSLAADPPWLPSKYHYDARGSEIFERITHLPEYYPTRTEESILERVADAVVADVEPGALIEYGSGSARKTRLILDAMERRGLLRGYGAVEVSESALRGSARALAERYPELRFEGVVADFESDVKLPFPELTRLILFLGSTIGNLTRREGIRFLRNVGARMRAADGLLIGFDLVKDVGRLEAAYNDSAGVTEEFSLNLLRVMNRELDGDFPLDAFRHEAIFNAEEARIEAYVVARRAVRVRLDAIDLELRLEEGERIRTEYSHKYTRESAGAILEGAGLRVSRWETDPENLFAVALARQRS